MIYIYIYITYKNPQRLYMHIHSVQWNADEASVELQGLDEHFPLCAWTRPATPFSFGRLWHENGYEPKPQKGQAMSTASRLHLL